MAQWSAALRLPRTKKTLIKLLPIEDDRLAAFCSSHHVLRLSVFGSRQKATARADSDLDLLVEFDSGREPGLLGLAAMESELSELLGGVRVELRTPRDLSPYVREEVVRSAELQYAR